MPSWGLGITIPLMAQMEKPRPVDDDVADLPMDADEATDRRELCAAIEAVARDYPEVPVERIEQLVVESFRLRSEATIRQYRGVLAERDVRARLRAEARSRGIGAATAETFATDGPSDVVGSTGGGPTPPLPGRPPRRWHVSSWSVRSHG
jgi:hypothetical protein